MPVQSLSASLSGPTTTLQSQSVAQGGAHGQTMSNVPSAQLAVTSSPAPADVSKQQQPSAAASSIRPQPQHPGAGPRKSKHADENTPRYTGLGSIVDFEKIYRFLSTVHVQSECFKLTPMGEMIAIVGVGCKLYTFYLMTVDNLVSFFLHVLPGLGSIPF